LPELAAQSAVATDVVVDDPWHVDGTARSSAPTVDMISELAATSHLPAPASPSPLTTNDHYKPRLRSAYSHCHEALLIPGITEELRPFKDFTGTLIVFSRTKTIGIKYRLTAAGL